MNRLEINKYYSSILRSQLSSLEILEVALAPVVVVVGVLVVVGLDEVALRPPPLPLLLGEPQLGSNSIEKILA